MLKTKRSQAALEFLMTYGWAILIVLIVISALAYFGVLNPQNLLPSKCTLPSGWSCTDYVVTGGATGEVKIKILNGMGTALKITSFNATLDTGASSCQSDTTIVYNLSNAQSIDLATQACSISDQMIGGGKYRWNLIIKYYPEGSDPSYTKTIQGELFTTVEP